MKKGGRRFLKDELESAHVERLIGERKQIASSLLIIEIHFIIKSVSDAITQPSLPEADIQQQCHVPFILVHVLF